MDNIDSSISHNVSCFCKFCRRCRQVIARYRLIDNTKSDGHISICHETTILSEKFISWDVQIIWRKILSSRLVTDVISRCWWSNDGNLRPQKYFPGNDIQRSESLNMRAPPWSSGSMLATDHYNPCSNLGVGISEGRFIVGFASLPCAQKWP